MDRMSNNGNNVISLLGGRYLYLGDYNQVINAQAKDLLLKYGSNRKIKTQDVAFDKKKILKKVRALCAMAIETTENCNLRCKYCIYSDHYKSWKKLSPRNIDFNTARKGLDYVFSLIEDRKKKNFSVGFYGGEPLLRFETIKKVVAYSKKLFAGWNLRFNMTTNLTLLDDEIMDFMVENNILLLVSLDGAKENHDCKRVYSNGKGTFDTIYNNLERMAEKHKDYFKNIGFTMVYSPDLSFKKSYEFFNGCDLFKDNRVRFSFVNPCNTTYYQTIDFKPEIFEEEYDDVFERIIDKIRKGEELTSLESFIHFQFKKIERYLQGRNDSLLAGSCEFNSRLYLDSHGKFHTCERINNKFPLGDVERGFDFEKMTSIVKKFTTLTKENCQDCNVRFLCSRCYVHFAGEGEFEFDPDFCASQKTRIISDLEKYIKYKEEGLG